LGPNKYIWPTNAYTQANSVLIIGFYADVYDSSSTKFLKKERIWIGIRDDHALEQTDRPS